MNCRSFYDLGKHTVQGIPAWLTLQLNADNHHALWHKTGFPSKELRKKYKKKYSVAFQTLSLEISDYH